MRTNRRLEHEVEHARFPKWITVRTFDSRFGDKSVDFFQRQTIGFDATGSLKRSDFGLGMAAPAVSDEVNLRITTEAAVDAPAAEPTAEPVAE